MRVKDSKQLILDFEKFEKKNIFLHFYTYGCQTRLNLHFCHLLLQYYLDGK